MDSSNDDDSDFDDEEYDDFYESDEDEGSAQIKLPYELIQRESVFTLMKQTLLELREITQLPYVS